jgi:hypothetical protein
MHIYSKPELGKGGWEPADHTVLRAGLGCEESGVKERMNEAVGSGGVGVSALPGVGADGRPGQSLHLEAVLSVPDPRTVGCHCHHMRLP